MRLGLSAYDLCARDVGDLSVAAEEAGFDSLWLGEHLLLPVGYDAVHPTRDAGEEAAARIVADDTLLTDPLVTLAAAASRTSRIRLATGIYLLALRHPLAVAQGVLSLQELAAGRFVFGVGAGWLEEEFAALGAPFAERVGRLEESLEVLRAGWAGGVFEHHGAHFDFGPVQVAREAVRVPIVMGGNSPAALRRAARLADGWFASGNPSTDETVTMLDGLRAACERSGRDRPIETFARVSPPDSADLDRYERTGLDELIVWAHELCPPAPDRWQGLAAARRRLEPG